MDLHLARMLQQHGQAVPPSARILELNAGHGLVRALADSVSGEKVVDDAGTYAHVLLDHARIAAGELPEDPALYSKRIADLLTKGL